MDQQTTCDGCGQTIATSGPDVVRGADWGNHTRHPGTTADVPIVHFHLEPCWDKRDRTRQIEAAGW